MMRILVLSLPVLFLCSCATLSTRDTEQMSGVSPEARPVATLLLAVQKNDMGAFKSLYSSRMKPIVGEQGWKVALEKYRTLFAEEFGNYQLADFAFSYSGDSTSGHVHITFRDKQMGELRVTREDSEWKLDEK